MKTFLSAVFENTRPLSKKLLFSCFIAGYILATLLFAFFGPQMHHFIKFNVTGIMNFFQAIINIIQRDRKRSIALFDLKRKLYHSRLKANS